MAIKRNSADRSIGVFDSGLGGLTVLKAVRAALPQYRYVYLGDTARMPYGGRNKEEILRFSKEAVDFLFKEGCELILFACNTASAEALREIQKNYLHRKYGKNKRVLGVIVPTLEYVAEDPAHRRVGVIATEGTVASGTFPRELKKIAPSVHVYQNAAPLLVPLVESGEYTGEHVDALLRSYLDPLLTKGIDTLVLGCTHYEHLLPQIRRIAGKGVKVVPESRIVAQKLKAYLARHPEIASVLSKRGGVTFYTTGEVPRFKERSKLFFGTSIRAHRAKL